MPLEPDAALEILSRLPLGLVVVDDSGVLYANPYTERLLDVAASALVGLRLPVDDETVDLLVGKDKPRILAARSTPIRWGGGHARLVVFEDVTTRRTQTEALQLEREEARRESELKSAFLANMSHEVRTPLNGVIGMADLLLDTELDDRQQAYAEMVRDSGRSLLSLLNAILDFAKLDAGRMQVERVGLNLREVVKSTLRPFELAARERGLRFRVRVDEAVPVGLIGDPIRIGQVLTNLVSNALKFTESGRVEVSVELLRETVDGVVLRFEVEDTGIGISDTAMARLFKPFSQADASTTRRYGGTGLGLAISRQLVELMDGRLEASSTPGRGTRFWFALPMGRSDSPGPGPITPLPVGPRVLVAEDNPVNQVVLGRLVERLGCTVAYAQNGAEAVKALERGEFDLILMDCQMPEMDGYEAARQIRAAGIDLPIIAVTASSVTEQRKTAIESGMDDILGKPIDPAALREALVRVLRSR